MSITDLPELLTAGEAAKELDRSSQRIRQMAVTGELPSVRTRKGSYLFIADDVRQHLARRNAGSR